MSSGRCLTCRHWGELAWREPDKSGWRQCTKAWAENGMCPLWEGADAIGTAPDFGCVLWEAKEPDE